ncbi:MAG: hypothetical protein IV100_28910 [Myxococcales bacterium]|nr:hypothetical protein [Myxococcales bacterium]
MSLFSLFSALSIALVAAQLDIVQHAALMELYNTTGEFADLEIFVFLLTWRPGCSTTFCPRFAANQPCSGAVSCNGTNVIALCVVALPRSFAHGSPTGP